MAGDGPAVPGLSPRPAQVRPWRVAIETLPGEHKHRRTHYSEALSDTGTEVTELSVAKLHRGPVSYN